MSATEVVKGLEPGIGSSDLMPTLLDFGVRGQGWVYVGREASEGRVKAGDLVYRLHHTGGS